MEVFGNISDNIKQLQKSLLDIQCNLKNGITAELIHQERKMRDDLESWLEKEQLLWAQKSRQMWLLNGDRNTSYFHKVVKRRRAANRILKIQDDQGRRVDRYEDVERLAVNYFQNLYSLDSQFKTSDVDIWLSEIGLPKLNEDHITALNKPILDAEILEAVNQLEAFNSPGPDGLPPGFY